MSALQRVAWPFIVVGIALAGACSGDSSGPGDIDQVLITASDGAIAPTVRRNQTLQLQATALSRGKEVSGIRFDWDSESPEFATVDNTGRVIGHEHGTATIRASPVGIPNLVGRLNVPVVGAPVATISTEAPSFVDVGDAVQIQAVAQDAGGATVTGVEFNWRSLSPTNATIDQNGQVTGHQPGQAVIEVEAWNGVTATVPIQVTPVTAIAPDTGRYGAIIALEGLGFPANPVVAFTGAGGAASVPVVVRSAGANRIEVWVPGGARSGPVHVQSGAGAFATSRTFTLTAEEDVFAEMSANEIQPLPFPFYNPGLFAYGGDGLDPPQFYYFFFEVTEPTPFTLELEDRGPRSGSRSTLWARMFRVTPPDGNTGWVLDDGIAWLETRNYVAGGTVRDENVYSREELEPGVYWLVVHSAFSPDDTPASDRSRPYGLRLEAATRFARSSDEFEPNDIPREAPLVPLPFSGRQTRFENAWAFDHYIIDVEEPSRIQATVSGPPTNWLAVLAASESADLMLSIVFENFVDILEWVEGNTIEADVDPGRYVILVWDIGGEDREYDLEIVATPVSGEEGEAAARVRAAGEPGFRALDRAAGARMELPPGLRARPVGPAR